MNEKQEIERQLKSFTDKLNILITLVATELKTTIPLNIEGVDLLTIKVSASKTIKTN